MTLAGDIKSGLASGFCNLFTGYDNVARYGAGMFIPDSINKNYGPSPQAKIANAGIALFCDHPPYVPPAGDFEGGQCSVNYSVNAVVDTYINNNLATMGEYNSSRSGIPGPIRTVKISPNGQQIRITYSAGLFEDFPGGSNPGGFSRRNLRDINIVRNDGQPDNCGNAEIVYPPSEPGDTTIDIDVNNSTGPVLFLPPILNFNGELSVPFNFDIGGIELSGTLELNTGDINLNFGGQPTDPTIPKTPTPDTDSPPADMDDPETGKKANIIGVIVVSTRTTDLSVTEIPESVMPDIYIPRLADVSFQIRIGQNTHWTSDLPVKSKNAWIPVPGVINAIDVGVQSKRGWTHIAVPVRGIVPSNQVTLV